MIKLSFYFLLLIGLAIGTANISAQTDFNLSLTDRPSDGGCEGYNDVWGFQHSNGREYAILGSICGLVIYEVTAEGKARKLKNINLENSLWRDIKNYGDFLYVTAEQGDTENGLLVVDMTSPTSTEISHSFVRPTVTDPTSAIGSAVLHHAHNLFIDQYGLAYVAGASQLQGLQSRRINNGGVLIFDLTANPKVPVMVGHGPPVYAHDVFVRDDLMVTSEIYDGKFAIHRLERSTEGVAVTTLSARQTDGRFTHNAWTTEDNAVVMITDEREGSPLQAYNIENPNQIIRLDHYLPIDQTDGDELAHNVHIHDGFAITSYYSEGIKVLDLKNPDNLVVIGAYDTNSARGGLQGCWGAYPFLPSGYLLASDMSNGLLVFRPDYAEAGRISGTIYSSDSTRIAEAEIFLAGKPFGISKKSNAAGTYTIGLVDQSTVGGDNRVILTICADEHEILEVEIELKPGETIYQDFYLESGPPAIVYQKLEGKSVGCTHQLEWKVVSLEGVQHFEVQTSTDGEHFTTIEIVEPASSSDTEFLVKYPQLSNRRYRLQEVNSGRKSSISPVVEISNANCEDFTIVFPNPTSNSVDIRSRRVLDEIGLFDTDGQLIRLVEFSQELSNQYMLDLSDLPTGLYILSVKNRLESETFRLFKN